MQCMKRSLKLSYICVYVCVCMKNLLLQQKIRESPIKAKLSLWRSSKFAFNVVSAWQPIDTMPTESPPTLPATRKWQHLHIHITYIYVLKMHSSVLCNVSGCVCVASTAGCPLTHTHTHRHVAILLCYGQIIWVRRVYLTIGNTHFTYVTDEANEADEADQAATGMLATILQCSPSQHNAHAAVSTDTMAITTGKSSQDVNKQCVVVATMPLLLSSYRVLMSVKNARRKTAGRNSKPTDTPNNATHPLLLSSAFVYIHISIYIRIYVYLLKMKYSALWKSIR